MTTFEKAKKKYNEIMYSLCIEHLTIGTRFSEGTENWNLRDMVSEMQYTLGIWSDEGCTPYIDAHNPYNGDHEETYKEWISGLGKMRRFIDRYLEEALTMKCNDKHCSKYD